MLIYAISLLLVAASWLLWWLQGWPLVAPIASTVVILMLTGGLLWWRRRAPGRPPRMKSDQSLDDANSSELLRMKQEVGQLLRQWQSQPQGAQARPFFLLLGPSSSGKTQLLQNCGLYKPLTPVDTTKPTPNCRGWQSPDAVMLDTSGRYLQDPSASAEWRALIELLAGRTRYAAISGLILTLSVHDLRRGTGLRELAQNMRKRLDETWQRLGCRVPVFVLVTHADELGGFADTFANPAQTSEPWGFTLPLHPNEQDSAAVDKAIQDLIERSYERVLLQLVRCEDPDKARRMHALSREMQKLQEPMRELCSELLHLSHTQEPPLLRGLYLASTGAGQAGQAPQAAMFVTSLLERRIMADVGLIQPSQAAKRQARRIQHWTSGCVLALSALFFCVSTTSFCNNLDLQDRVLARSRVVDDALHSDASWQELASLVKLDEALATQQALPSLLGHFGMYQGESLARGTRALLVHKALQHWVSPLVRKDERALKALVTQHEIRQQALDERAYTRSFDQLRRYLLLTKSTHAPERLQDPKQRAWLRDNMAGLWQAAGAPFAQAKAMASRFVEHLSQDPYLAHDQNPQLVRRAQQVLTSSVHQHLQLDLVLSDIHARRPPLRLRDMVAHPYLSAGAHKIRAGFTRQTYQELVDPALDKVGASNQSLAWVLGDQGQGGDPKSLRARYLRAYQEEWSSFLSKVQLVPPHNETQLLRMLDELAHPAHSPYLALFSTVGWQTTLESKPPELVDAVAKHAPGSKKALAKAKSVAPKVQAMLAEQELSFGPRDLQAAFWPLHRFGLANPDPAANAAKGGGMPASTGRDFRGYAEELRQLATLVRDQQGAASNARKEQKALQAIEARVQGIVMEQDPVWRPIMAKLLLAPIRFSTHMLSGSRKSSVERAYCESILPAFRQDLLAKYPFSRSSRQDAQIADLTKLLHPETGQLWTFVDQELSPYISKERQSFRAIDLGEGVRAELLDFLRAASRLSHALFPSGHASPSVEYRVQAMPEPNVVESFVQSDDQRYTYQNGPLRAHRFRWPQDTDHPSSMVRAQLKAGQGQLRREGVWSWFRLLEDAQIAKNPKSNSFRASWYLLGTSQSPLTLQVSPSAEISPFFGDAKAPGAFLEVFRTPTLRAPSKLFSTTFGCQ